jgi:hypothetical protein
MAELGRNGAVSLVGVIAAVFFFHLGTSASYLRFENPDPPVFSYTGPLWVLLLLATPLGIGYFATRMPSLQSAFVFVVVSLIVKRLDLDPDMIAGRDLPLREYLGAYFHGYLRDCLVGIPVVCALAYVGVWLRRRRNARRGQGSDALPG